MNQNDSKNLFLDSSNFEPSTLMQNISSEFDRISTVRVTEVLIWEESQSIFTDESIVCNCSHCSST